MQNKVSYGRNQRFLIIKGNVGFIFLAFFLQMISVEDDDLAGLEDVSSDNEDDNYEADLSDSEVLLTGTMPVKRPYKKKSRSMFL